MCASKNSTSVQNQYENYPYPPRNPEDEHKQLHTPSKEYLDSINHYCFEGKQDFQNNFRILVAGGGTGDATIFLAEQLRDTNAEIIHLDFSSASIDIAKQRAKIRGLSNITWIQDSILTLSKQKLGTFDYINCSGVLHHLEDPEKGLKVLSKSLNSTGAISIMLYGKYGRAAIYQMQELMQRLNQNVTDIQSKIDNCRKVLAALPSTNLYKMSGALGKGIDHYTDSDIYDLFLHSQDQAYSITDIYNMMDRAKLHISYISGTNELEGNLLLKPGQYIKDPVLLEKISQFPERKQQAIAELCYGRIARHSFYATKQKKAIPQPDNEQLVPFLSSIFDKDAYRVIRELVLGSTSAVEINHPPSGRGVKFLKPVFCNAFFNLFDGKKTLQEIFDTALESYKQLPVKPTRKQLQEEFNGIYNAFSIHNWMFLKAQNVPEFPSGLAIQQAFHQSLSKEVA